MPASGASESRCPTCGTLAWTNPGGSSAERDSAIYVASGTRHRGLLSSNEAPLELDLAAVKSVISDTDARLVCLDTKISRLQDRLKRLEEERAAVSRYHAQNNAILSPLRRMPPEVLGEIFSWTLPSARDAVALGRRGTTSICGSDVGSSPWILGHISSRWRAIALSTPSLWSLVVVNLPRSLSRYPLPMLDAQLARARNLKIQFYGCANSEPGPQIVLFQRLAERSSLWEELSISLTPDLVHLLDNLRDRTPSLRRLWIQWDYPESPGGLESIDCFRTACGLVDVGIYTRYRHVPILFPGRQLTRYQLNGPWATHQGILKTAPNLVEARITIAWDDEPWPEHDDTAIDVLYLKRLWVSEWAVLRFLRTPALEEIAFRIYENDENDPDLLLPDFAPFVVRSACNIRRICFRGSPDADQIGEILQRYPSLTELAIITHTRRRDDFQILREATNTLISQLIVPNTAGGVPLSPQLSTIHFGCEDETSLDYALYFKMLESRWKADSCVLKSAALVTDSGPALNAATLAGFHSLRKDGLSLALLSGKTGSDFMRGWTYH